MNPNIKPTSVLIEPTTALTDSLNNFDDIAVATFGSELGYIKHELWSEHVSFTSVKLTNGDYIGFRVSANGVIDDTFNASIEHLRKAFRAFDIEMPSWMYC